MENKKKLIVIVAVFILVMLGAYLLYSRLMPEYNQDPLTTLASASHETQNTQETTQETTQGTTEQVSNQAPDFTVYDADGNPVQLSDYFGKPIVLNFWASWCGPCQSEMPDFDAKYQELGNDVQFLMINMTDGARETVDRASEFIAQKGYTFPVFFDTDLDAAIRYNVYAIPMTFFIDSSGNLIARAARAIDAETLQLGIDMIT